MDRFFGPRKATPFLPYRGHIAPGVVLLRDGSLMAMGTVKGLPHELAADAEREAASWQRNVTLRQIAGDNIGFWTHFTRRLSGKRPAPSFFPNQFAAAIESKYINEVLGQLYQNSWYVTLIVSPRLSPALRKAGRGVARVGRKFRRDRPNEIDVNLEELDDLWSSLARGLGRYGVVRLGLRQHPYHSRVRFSEPAEALCEILGDGGRQVPLPQMRVDDGDDVPRLGEAIYSSRAIFGPSFYGLTNPGGRTFKKHGAIFGFKHYPHEIDPAIWDPLIRFPGEAVLSQSYLFEGRAEALHALTLTGKQKVSSGDPALDEIELAVAAKKVGRGDVQWGSHHVSLAVYHPTVIGAERAAIQAKALLSDTGAIIEQESKANEAAYWAQLPGNDHVRPRAEPLDTECLADLSGFPCYPDGDEKGWWDDVPLMMIPTAGRTAYGFVPHVGDSGNIIVCGPTRSGKTVFLMLLAVMFGKHLGADGFIFFIERGRSGEMAIRALGGAYLFPRPGRSSGMVPLKALSNTPGDCDWLIRFIHSLILWDGGGEISALDREALADGVRKTMRLRPALREIGGVRLHLDRSDEGAGKRLERWCRGNAMGWAFDGEADEVDTSGIGFGVDFTEIVDIPEILNPAGSYLLYRIQGATKGRRHVGIIDEAQFLLVHPFYREAIGNFYRREGKENGVVITATQLPSDYYVEGSFGPMIMSQAKTKMFFGDASADERFYKDVLHFTHGQYIAVRDLMPIGSRKALVKRDEESDKSSQERSVILDTTLHNMEDELALLAGRANTVKLAESIWHKEGWVEEFMARRKEAVD